MVKPILIIIRVAKNVLKCPLILVFVNSIVKHTVVKLKYIVKSLKTTLI